MALCTVSFGSGFVDEGIQGMDQPDTGFDSFTVKGRFEGTEAQLVTLLNGSLAYGTAHADFANMVINSRKPKRLKTDLWSIDLGYKGLVADKVSKRKGKAYPNKSSGNFIVSGSNQPTSPMQTEVSEPAVSLTFTYVSLTTPDTDEIATAQTPPDTVPTPPYLWASLVDPIYQFPNGWVLENRDFDELPGSDICFVTDEYVYYHILKPGGG